MYLPTSCLPMMLAVEDSLMVFLTQLFDKSGCDEIFEDTSFTLALIASPNIMPALTMRKC